jgi:hypothetical protein
VEIYKRIAATFAHELTHNITGNNEKIIIPVSYNTIDYVRHSLVSWSFAFLDPIAIRTEEQVVLTARNHAGKVFLNFGLR